MRQFCWRLTSHQTAPKTVVFLYRTDVFLCILIVDTVVVIVVNPMSVVTIGFVCTVV